MNRSAAHHQLRNEIRIAIGSRRGVFVQKHDPIKGTLILPDGRTAYVDSELAPGFPDIAGWVSTHGCPALWFGMEVKTGAAVRNANQRKFHAFAERSGALIEVVRSVAEAVAFVDRVEARARELAALLTQKAAA